MRLKTRPRKPKKIKEILISFQFNRYKVKTLEDFVIWANQNKVNYKDVILSIEYDDCDYDVPIGRASFKREETDDEYKIRLERYKKDLKAWNSWYRENAKEIEETLKERQVKKDKNRDRRIQKLEEELAKLKVS